MQIRIKLLRSIANPALRALLVSDALILTAVAMLAPIYALYVTDIGGSIFDAGLTAAALAFGAGVMSIIAGRYIDTQPNKRLVLVGGYLVVGIGFLLYTQVTSVLFLGLIQLFIGLMQPFYQTAFDTLYSTHLDTAKVAREWGWWEATKYFTTAAGAIVGSLIVVQFGFDGLFIVMASFCFLSAVHVLRLPKKLLR